MVARLDDADIADTLSLKRFQGLLYERYRRTDEYGRLPLSALRCIRWAAITVLPNPQGAWTMMCLCPSRMACAIAGMRAIWRPRNGRRLPCGLNNRILLLGLRYCPVKEGEDFGVSVRVVEVANG